jgi:hypothetical protein
VTEYKEIVKLKAMLEAQGIKHKFKKFLDGYQIVLEDGSDIIEHFGSYGNEDDLLEVMGSSLLSEYANDSVEGHLSAEEVFKRITGGGEK